MLSSAKKACFLNKKWLSLFALSQTCKQIINSTISHFGHDTNHNFHNETPSHFGACSLRSPMKCNNKILESPLREFSTTNTWRKDYNLFPFHRVNKTKDCPLDCVPFLRASQRCKSKLLSWQKTQEERKNKSKKSLNLQSVWVTPGGRCGRLVVHGISWCLVLHVFSLSARSLDLFLSKPNYP